MNQLADRQAQFQAHLTSGAEAVTAHIIGDDKADSETRLQVYFQAYRLRLIEVLQNDFEGLHTLLGDEGFSRMVQAYLAKHPSRHPSVRWFGQHLPVFLSSQPEYAEHPVLAEMARFEWAWGLAFDAADRSAPGVAAMTEIDPEAWGSLQVEVQPSVQQLSLSHNVPAIFQAATNQATPPPVEIAASPVSWVLWRRDLIVCWRSLEPDEAWALEAAVGGASFAQVCEGLCQWHEADAVPLRAAGMLRGWLEDELLAGISG
jgi:hypothetical protein